MLVPSLLLALAGGVSLVSATATLPVTKVRGVNLGGLFVSEPWMMTSEWNRMGCGAYTSEFDCMSNVADAQAGFTSHWDTWITQADITKMASYGLNTIRIPLGYWIVESTVDLPSEHFPTGGFAYLKAICGWASAAGINVILDLHGAPGAQQVDQPSTGQYAPTVGFYDQYNYDRAYAFFTNITTEVHQNAEFDSVFAVEAVNEPLQSTTGVEDMISNYYPGVLNAVRTAESALGITCSSSSRRSLRSPSSRQSKRAGVTGCLNVEYMDSLWWSGEPSSSLPNTVNVVYDDHTYVKYTSATATRDGYMTYSCTNNPTQQTDTPVITGEWSLSVAGDNTIAELSTTASDASTFFYLWGSAQMSAFDKGAGWIFWTWKTDTLNDPRWDYQLAVSAGYLPATAGSYNTNACSGY